VHDRDHAREKLLFGQRRGHAAHCNRRRIICHRWDTDGHR
jgi:hypothetical protein